MNYALLFKNKYGCCPQCKEANHDYAWCNRCDRKALVDKFNTWSTGNNALDLFIQETQRTATCYVLDRSYYPIEKKTYLEYVPYDRFTDVKSFGGLGDFTAIINGGLGEVLTATWLDGKRVINYNEKIKERSSPHTVSLEVVGSSTKIDHAIDEVITDVCLPSLFHCVN